MKPFRTGGSQDLEAWSMGAQILKLDELQVNDIILQDSLQFDAHNLVKITKINFERGICYGHFVEPTNTDLKRRGSNADDFAIWDFEINSNSHKHYRVSSLNTIYEKKEITPDIVSLEDLIKCARVLICDKDNTEYIRGICEVIAVVFPTKDCDTEERAQQIEESIFS